MQIIIDIPEEYYKEALRGNFNVTYFGEAVRKHSTPLPKGHGRLIDADEVVKEICIEYKANSIYELPNKLRSFVKKYLNEVPTILNPTPEYMIKNYAFFKK